MVRNNPLGTSSTLISLSDGYLTNYRFVAIRESDNQLIGFMYGSNDLIPGPIMDIATPEKVIAVVYNGNYICIQSLTNLEYCLPGFSMIPGLKVQWQKLGIALTSIRVGVTRNLLGIDANQNHFGCKEAPRNLLK
jgi:hypothetical protein